jgi:diadenosine tetraphosphate (Ap4A) HIT family hydrolase
VEGCLACDIAAGRVEIPGGIIMRTDCFRIDHCVGPLGVGTLIVAPLRHVTRVSDLTADEAEELGLLLYRAACVVDQLVRPEQVYTCLWSHAGGEPGHIHWVVQPVTRAQMDALEAHGPKLQVAMFERDDRPPPDEVEQFARRAADVLAG